MLNHVGVEVENLPDYDLRELHHRLVPAMSILAMILMLWGLMQFVDSIQEFTAYQSAEISLILLFFAAFVLLAFFTSIVKKRFYILAGCVLLAMLITPPDLLSQLKIALPLVVLFEFSVLLAKRLGTAGDFPDAV